MTEPHPWLVHFSADHHRDTNPHSRHHIVRALSAHFRVLWINPYGFRWPAGRSWIPRAMRKLRHWTAGATQTSEGWVVANPIALPIVADGIVRTLHEAWLRRQVRRLLRRHGVNRGVLFFTTPKYAPVLERDSDWPSVFYLSDAYSLHRELSPKERAVVRKEEDWLLTHCRRVICSSRPIYEDVRGRTRPDIVIHFPHQVDFARFAAARERGTAPADIASIPRPRIGYYGTLTDSNDWDLMGAVVRARPNYHFVFIGRKEIESTGLESLPNVHFLGFRPYETIPDYGAAFDVAVMFWVRRDWIRHCSPLKLKEYLALGKPVVSTYIEDVAWQFGQIVSLAHTAEEFLAALDRGVLAPDLEKIQRGIEAVRDDSWNRIVPLFLDLID